MNQNNKKEKLIPSRSDQCGDIDNEDNNDGGEDIEVIEVNPDQLPEDELGDDLADIGMDQDEDDDYDEDDEELEEELDEPVQKIEKHKGSVFCIDVSGNRVATGGEDDLGYVFAFDSSDPSKPAVCELESEKFSDSVTQVRFNQDSKMVAMCDMSGRLRVYSSTSSSTTYSLVWSHEIESDVEQVSWHPEVANVLFCSTSDGYFYMFKVSASSSAGGGGGENSEMRVMYAGDNVGLSCFRVLKDGKRAVCCYNSGTIRFWDLKSNQPITSLVNCHDGEIICCELNHEGNLLATGGTDLKLRIISTNNGKLLSTLDCKSVTKSSGGGESKKKRATKNQADDDDDNDDDDDETAMAAGAKNPNVDDDDEDSIESIAFASHLQLVACASLSGHVIIWDLNTQSIRCRFDNHSVGYSKLAWAGEKIYAATLAGHLQIFDGRNLDQLSTLRCHQDAEILDFKIDTTRSLVCTAASDGLVKIFKID